MRSVMHLLPHAGGGGETYLRLLAGMPGWRHERTLLSPTRNMVGAGLIAPARLVSLLRRSRDADLVHVHGDSAAILALPLLKRRPAVITTHGLHLLRRVEGPVKPLVENRLRHAIERARCVICCSSPERDELRALAGDGAANLVVVPNGIDLPPAPERGTRSQVRAELGLAEGDVVALYLGQLEPRKDPVTAVAAAERAAAGGQPLRLLVAGDGPLLGEVRGAAGPATSVLGFRDDPGRLLEAADVFVMPSLREGASFAALEAMGRGLAMVVSDGAGNPELVGDGGVVFPVGDAGALSDALTRLAADESERERLGTAARERVAERFSREGMVRGVERAYEEALTGPGRGGA